MARGGFKFYESVNGVWLTKEVPFKYMRREIFDINIVFSVVAELKSAFEKDDAEDIIDEQIIGTYGWEYVQQALIQILFDDNNKKETYSSVADIFWSAVLKNQKMRKKLRLHCCIIVLGMFRLLMKTISFVALLQSCLIWIMPIRNITR